jgi:hypothetical protein
LLVPPRQAAARVTLRNGINLTDRSIPRGYRRPGRRPHVPSSKPTMSKSRRISSPGRLFRVSVSRLRETRTRWRTEWAAPAAVRGHICRVPHSVNSLIQKIRTQRAICRKRFANLRFRMSSGRLNISPQCFGLGLDPLDSMLHEVADRDDSPDLARFNHRQMPHPALGHRR